MNECENCGESVDSRWKFCLNCGARMPVTQLAPTGSVAFAGVPQFDEPVGGTHAGKRRFRFDWQLTLGVALALGGVAMIVYLVVVLVVPHA